MEKEIIALFLPLIALVIRYLINIRIDRKESLDEALKRQRSQDQASAYVLTERLECNRRVRLNTQTLQEQMDQDMSRMNQRHEDQENPGIQEIQSKRDSQHE